MDWVTTEMDDGGESLHTMLTFQHRAGLEKLVLQLVALPLVRGDGDEVAQRQLGRLRLAGARFTAQHHALITVEVAQASPGSVGHGVAEKKMATGD